jgi:hypothetical protein
MILLILILLRALLFDTLIFERPREESSLMLPSSGALIVISNPKFYAPGAVNCIGDVGGRVDIVKSSNFEGR